MNYKTSIWEKVIKAESDRTISQYLMFVKMSVEGFTTSVQFSRNLKKITVPWNCCCFPMMSGTGKSEIASTLEEEEEIPAELM